MPKLRLTERQEREKALRRAIARAKVDLDLEKESDLMDYLNIPRTTFYHKRQEPYRGFGFEEAAELARKLHFTAQELCAIFGVPYESGRDASCA